MGERVILLWVIEAVLKRLAYMDRHIFVPSLHLGDVDIQWCLQRHQLFDKVLEKVDAQVEIGS